MYKCRLYQFLLHMFFVNTYDTVHIVLIKIHIVFTIAYNTYGACGEFFFSEQADRGCAAGAFFLWGGEGAFGQKRL